MEKPFSAYRGDGPYVFVCYAHEDSDRIYREIAWLNDYGVNVWYDEGISPGHEWTDELAGAIQGCTKVLYFVTPSSVISEHCRRELNFAQEERREVVAIHLQETDVPAGLRLSLNNRQAIFRHQLSDEDYHRNLIRLTHETSGPRRSPTAQPNSLRSKRWIGVAFIVLVLSATAGGLWWVTGKDDLAVDVRATSETGVPSGGVLGNSIAVLPFDNLSLQPEDAFFAAGIHEEILNQLAKIKDLSVIARTTMLGYAETDKSIPQIASELNVGTVMEGSVRYAGDRVRITAQLIDAQSGAHLWSEAFEEDLEDVFEIQLRIASRIADTLDAEFSVVERERMAVRPTEDAEAYTHYLRAVSSFGNFAMIGPMHEALDEAIAADPAFASALAFKSWLHTIEAIAGPLFVGPGFNIDDQRRSIDLAQGYARRTLELDDRQAQAHLALAWARMLNRNWKAAFERFDRAYSLNPNSYFAVNNAAWTSLYRDDVELAIELVERSVELNPADFANQNNASELFYIAERWEDARRQAELVTKLAPDAAYGFASLALANARLGDAAGVRASAAMAEARNPNLHEYAKIAQAHSLIGDSGQAKRIFDAASAGDESVTRNPVFHYEMRMAIKDWEGAVSYAEKALLEGFHGYIIPNLHFRPGHPDFDPIRSHPKFEELVRMASTTVGRWGASG